MQSDDLWLLFRVNNFRKIFYNAFGDLCDQKGKKKCIREKIMMHGGGVIIFQYFYLIMSEMCRTWRTFTLLPETHYYNLHFLFHVSQQLRVSNECKSATGEKKNGYD